MFIFIFGLEFLKCIIENVNDHIREIIQIISYFIYYNVVQK